jgi:pyrroloquinoline-quinone synthase
VKDRAKSPTLKPKTAEEIEAIVQRHPLVKHHGLPLDSMDLIRAHQMVEAGHRHDAYAMVVNYAMTQAQQQAVLSCLKKSLTFWLAYRDAVAKVCGLKKTSR